MSGALVSPPRLRNPAIPKAISDIVMRAMAPEIPVRYQRASDLLDDVLAAKTGTLRRTPSGKSEVPAAARTSREEQQGIQSRLRARDTPAPRFCWQCHKPLHARADVCPFCNEKQ
jgi:hypothetical protein